MSKIRFFICLILSQFLFSTAHSYDQVKISRVIPLVDRKANPTLLKHDKNKALWIFNSRDNSLQQISEEGKPQTVLYSGKTPANFFRKLIDFDFSSKNDLVVADAAGDLISIVSNDKGGDWKKAQVVSRFEVKGVSCFAIGHDDIMAVFSKGQSFIQIYSIDGILLHRIFADDTTPFKSIESLVFGKDGVLWALDSGTGFLHRFSANRKTIGITKGLDGAKALALDEYGFAYVSLSSGKWVEINAEGVIQGHFGARGKNPGELSNPNGVSIPDSTNLWIADTNNNRIQIFSITNKSKTNKLVKEPCAYVQPRFVTQLGNKINSASYLANGDIFLYNTDSKEFELIESDGKSKSKWKKKGKGSTGFANPAFINLDQDSNIWIADNGDHSLKKVSPAGEISRVIGQKGKKEGSLANPAFFTIRKDGSFVIVDKSNSRVQVLSNQGLYLFPLKISSKGDGGFGKIVGIASNNELTAVLDGGLNKLVFFNSNGKVQIELANQKGRLPNWNQPAGIATDSEGRFFVLDSGFERVRIFSPKGAYLGDFSAPGTIIACGPNHRVLIADDKNVRIYTVSTVPKQLANVEIADKDGDLTLTWDHSLEATKYNIYRSSGSNPYTFLANTIASPHSDSTLKPNVEYTYAVTGVSDSGFEGNWSPSKSIKASRRKDVSYLSFVEINFNPVFTAAAKYYVSNPIGSITIQNNDIKTYRNVKLTMNLIRYCDFPTEVTVSEMEAGEKKTIPVTMTFNDKVLELTEDTPIQMDIKISYFEDNQEKFVTQRAPILLNSRNAISWSDHSRIASFVTPRDTPIIEFSRSAIRSQLALLKGSTVTKPLAKAALFYESLNALKIAYVPDPKTPFTEVSGKPEVLDYVQFPRETLRRKTGDCDDTSALLATLLESVGVEVAFVDTPGHIFIMVNTEETDADVIGLPEERFVLYKGTYWVPIETTQLGKPFSTAWQTGISQVVSGVAKNKIEYISISEAHKIYPPVTLTEVENELVPYPVEIVNEKFPAILKEMQAERFEGKLKEIKSRIKASPKDSMLVVQLGMVFVEGGKTEDAKKIFTELLNSDKSGEIQSAARNNLGNISYLAGDYKDASIHYEKASLLAPTDGGILINRARVAWKTGDKAAVTNFLTEAQKQLSNWQDFTSDLPAELLPKIKKEN